MKRGTIIIAALVIAVVAFAAPVEEVISFQGKLVEAGVPVDGTRNIEFKLYDVATGGVALWTENHLGVTVAGGLFNVELGGASTFDAAGLDFSEQYWIGISVSGGAEITPRYKLTGTPYSMADGDWVIDGTDMYTGITGNVGIGTTSPGAKLDVDGNVSVPSGNFYAFMGSGWCIGKDHNADVGNTEDIQVEGWGGMTYAETDIRSFQVVSQTGTSPYTSHVVMQANLNDGKVGIGTTTPTHRLTISNTVDENALRLIGPDGGTYGYGARLSFGDGTFAYIEEATDDDIKIHASDLILEIGGDVGSAGDVLVSDGTSADWQDLTTLSDGDWAYSSGTGLTGDIYHDGNVGINTTTAPAVVLDIYGTQAIGATSDGVVNIGNSAGSHLTFDSNEIHARSGTGTSNLYINDFGGNVYVADCANFYQDDKAHFLHNVGIGESSPDCQLHLKSSLPEIKLENSAATGATQKITFWDGSTEKFAIGYDLWGAGDDIFTLYETDGVGPVLTIENGNVGVGNTGTPNYKFEVHTDHAYGTAAEFLNDGNNGNRYGIRIQCGTDDGSGTSYFVRFYDGDGGYIGNIRGSGGTMTYGTFTADHIASVPTSKNETGYEYGTIMCIKKVIDNPEKPKQPDYYVEPSTEPYATDIFGIYSSKLDDEENQHSIFCIGDGHVLVNESNGVIEAGDRITTSSMPGVGMKATKAGNIIAIALESSADGEDIGGGVKRITVSYAANEYYAGDSIEELQTQIEQLKAEIETLKNNQ